MDCLAESLLKREKACWVCTSIPTEFGPFCGTVIVNAITVFTLVLAFSSFLARLERSSFHRGPFSLRFWPSRAILEMLAIRPLESKRSFVHTKMFGIYVGASESSESCGVKVQNVRLPTSELVLASAKDLSPMLL